MLLTMVSTCCWRPLLPDQAVCYFIVIFNQRLERTLHKAPSLTDFRCSLILVGFHCSTSGSDPSSTFPGLSHPLLISSSEIHESDANNFDTLMQKLYEIHKEHLQHAAFNLPYSIPANSLTFNSRVAAKNFTLVIL
jgi:hypothetical protein